MASCVVNWFKDAGATAVPALPFPVVDYGTNVIAATPMGVGVTRLQFIPNVATDYLPKFVASFTAGQAGQLGYFHFSNQYANHLSWNMVSDGSRQQSPFVADAFMFNGGRRASSYSTGSVCVGFKNNSTNLSHIPKGNRQTAYVDIEGLITRTDVMNAFVAAMDISTSEMWELEVTSAPSNGDFFLFTNSLDVYAAVFHISGIPFPTLPSGTYLKALIIKINGGDSNAEIATKIADAITNWIIYIPTAAEAQLPAVSWFDYHLVV